MNPYFFNLAYNLAKRQAKRKHKMQEPPEHKVIWEKCVSIAYYFKNTLFIILGVLSAGFALKGFLLPNAFIDGGVTGISLLVSLKTGLPLALLVVIINIPFFIFGLSQINKWFVLKSICAVSGLALALIFIDYPIITSDKLLVAVFGGIFLGAGIGACYSRGIGYRRHRDVSNLSKPESRVYNR